MKTIECVDCGESVPYGRLSCPACGALLASVARGRAPVVRVAAPAEPLLPDLPASVVVEPLFPDLPTETPSLWPPLEEVPEPILAPRPYRPPAWAGVAVAPEAPAPRVAAPGAYRPPTFSLAAAGAGVAAPAWPDGAGFDGGRSGGGGGMAEHEAKAPLGAIEAARFVEIAGWCVVVGSTLAVLGFFLPWSRTVIGAASYGDYFDGWGLASPTHMLVLAGLLAVLALGIVRTPVPIWLRTGVLGLGLGGLLVGLVWPYLVGPLGADVGVLCVGLGGVAMVIGGAVASWATRHVEAEPVV